MRLWPASALLSVGPPRVLVRGHDTITSVQTVLSFADHSTADRVPRSSSSPLDSLLFSFPCSTHLLQPTGRAIALKYAAHGSNVVVVSRKRPLLETLAAEMRATNANARVHVLPADLSSNNETKRVVAEAAAALGGDIDVLVLNHIRPYMTVVQSNDES